MKIPGQDDKMTEERVLDGVLIQLNIVNGRNRVWPGTRTVGDIAHAQLLPGDRREHLTNI